MSAATVKRILVTLDSSDTGMKALDMAARLAAMLQAELEGVFVEDINLIDLSNLPFLREIGGNSLIEAPVDSARMQRDLAAQARQAKNLLIQQAQSTGVSYSFRVWRGHATLDTLSASFEADILSIGRSPAYRRYTEKKTPHPVERICVLFSGSEQSEKTLHAASRLSENLDVPIRVFLAAETAAPDKLEQQVITVLATHQKPLSFVRVDGLPALGHALNTAGNTVLFVEAGHPWFAHPDFSQYLGAIATPVLIVR